MAETQRGIFLKYNSELIPSRKGFNQLHHFGGFGVTEMVTGKGLMNSKDFYCQNKLQEKVQLN